MDHHLAQLNIAHGRAPLADPIMAGFVTQLDWINASADAADGFVWRLDMPDPEAASLQLFGPNVLVNLSLWTSVEALHQYAYRGARAGPLRDRRRWFVPMEGPSSVLWWVPVGHRPTLEEAKTRLRWLAEDSPTARAFTFAEPAPPPTADDLTAVSARP